MRMKLRPFDHKLNGHSCQDTLKQMKGLKDNDALS